MRFDKIKLMSYLQLSIITLCAVCVCYVVYKVFIDQGQADREPTTAELAAKARKRLIAALLGDSKAADRLIALEHKRAGGIGIGKLEAVNRALESLQRDRSRTN
ncbi:hypothetical protein [Herminiimonas contaminans]|uniref:Uncharacterized protein n=1 Tax=Herminiimonas contaminans TaxID=1111140 RepID=A0ABS0EW77_9BURK|nr:hypothetical protein [Herminiimonas contaminans]MBF8179092.1 hypothetical protein [Herminiimonas contaminans]